MLKIIISDPEKPLRSSLSNIRFIYEELSIIYLKWNKRNDKKVLKELDRLKSDFPEVFDKKKPHLELLRM